MRVACLCLIVQPWLGHSYDTARMRVLRGAAERGRKNKPRAACTNWQQWPSTWSAEVMKSSAEARALN